MKTRFKYALILFVFLLLLSCGVSRQSTKIEQSEPEVSFKAREYYLKGLFLQSEERFSEALVQFHKAQIFDTTSATIYNSLAENYMKLNEFEPASYHLKRALKLDPDNIESLRMLAEIYFRQRKDAQAIKVYEKILSLDPYNEDARNFLFFLYEKNKDYQAKIRLYEQMLDIYGDNTEILKQIADIYINQEQYEKASEVYLQILDNDSLNWEAHYRKGQLQEELNRFDLAKESYLKAIELNPDNTEVANKLAFLYRKDQEYQKVIDLYSPILSTDSLNFTARIYVAESYYFLEKPKETLRILRTLPGKKEVPWGVYDLLGRVELEEKNYDKAIRYFSEIVDNDKNNRFGWLFLGFTYSDMGNDSLAASKFSEGLNYLPRDAALWAWYGISLQRQKKYSEAISPLEKAIILDPQNINALSSLPVVFEELDMFAQSDSVYQLALEQLPENALLLNNFAYSLSERNFRLNEALEMSQKAIEKEPENAAYLDTIGWIYYKLEKYDEALKYIQQSLEIRPNSAVVLEHLGDVYFKIKDLENARKYWQKSLDLQPSNPQLTEKLENF